MAGVKKHREFEDAVKQARSNLLDWVAAIFSVPLALLSFGVTIGWIVKGFRHAA